MPECMNTISQMKVFKSTDEEMQIVSKQQIPLK